MYVYIYVCIYTCTYVIFSVEVSCDQPGIPSNGRVDTSAGTSFGDVARYSCNTGYTLNGTAERICQANREWNGSVPACERELAPYLHSYQSYVCLRR